MQCPNVWPLPYFHRIGTVLIDSAIGRVASRNGRAEPDVRRSAAGCEQNAIHFIIPLGRTVAPRVYDTLKVADNGEADRSETREDVVDDEGGLPGEEIERRAAFRGRIAPVSGEVFSAAIQYNVR